MPRRSINKHAGIIVKVKKEKDEKKGAKRATTQQASKQFYCYPMGNETENNTFLSLCPDVKTRFSYFISDSIYLSGQQFSSHLT